MVRAVALFAFCWLLACGHAHAFGTVYKESQTVWTAAAFTSCKGSTGQEAIDCAKGLRFPYVSGSDRYSFSAWSAIVTNTSSQYTRKAHVQVCNASTGANCGMYWDGDQFTATSTTTLACPALSTPKVGGAANECTCMSTMKKSGNACVEIGLCDTVVQGLNVLGEPVKSTGGVGSLTACFGGCKVSADFGGTGANSSWWLFAPYKATGGNCDSGTESGSNVEAPPVACPKGQCPGTVNGTSVCAACSSTTVPGASSAASAPTGASAPALGDGAPPGAVSSNTSTTCTGVTCTTTTTYKDAAGNVVGTRSEDQTQGSFCKENPQISLCKAGSFGGSCSATFSCEGDAVQCAIVKEQYVRNCQLFDTETALSSKGREAANGQAQPSGHPGAAVSSTSMSFATVIDQTDSLGGSCPQDVAISYAGRSFVIPWSKACAPLQMVGNLAVGVCMLAAAFIVFRS